MAEYINKNEVKYDAYDKFAYIASSNKKLLDDFCDALSLALDSVETINIVRCKDCKHKDRYGYCKTVGNNPPEDFWCARGEEE